MDELDALLTKLGLEDSAQVEYARGILLDEGAEEDADRQEAVMSLVEEPSAEAETSFPAILALSKNLRDQDSAKQAQLMEEQKRKQREEAQRRAQAAKQDLEAENSKKSEQGLDKKPTISADERARLLREYGNVVDKEEVELDGAESNPLDHQSGKKKKGKEALPSDLLSIVNDNASKVAEAQRVRREDAAKSHQAKKAKDKQDLQKQREGQEKRKKDAQDRAKKQERRA